MNSLRTALVVDYRWSPAEAPVSGLFSPRLEVLPPPQRRLWNELAEIPPEFVLYGGTAIALYLGHRQSADFDFFGNRALDPNHLTLAIPFLNGATVTQREPNTLSCVVDRDGPVQLSFFGLPEVPRLRPPSVAPDNGLRVASLIDLAGMKASVVQMRAEAKDYVDIDAILADGRIDLPTALAGAREIYGSQFNPQITLKALSYFDDGDLPRLPQRLKDRLAHAVSAVDLGRLPVVAAETRART
jgi:Nucleotidyl transferase AbiEii toxin, Type IV TA system